MIAYLKAAQKILKKTGSSTNSNGGTSAGSNLAKAFYNKPFWIFMSLGLIAGVLYWIFRAGKSKGAIDAKIPFVDVPDSETITKSFKETALGYVNELFRLTEGIDWWGNRSPAKSVLYAKLVKLDKAQLIYTYDLWLQKFWVEREETLYETIDDDWGGGENKTAILERLKSYGLY